MWQPDPEFDPSKSYWPAVVWGAVLAVLLLSPYFIPESAVHPWSHVHHEDWDWHAITGSGFLFWFLMLVQRLLQRNRDEEE